MPHQQRSLNIVPSLIYEFRSPLNLKMQPFIPFGIQTGDDDASARSSFATSMIAYDDHLREIIILGGTYSNYFNPGVKRNDRNDSDCFVAIQNLRREDPNRLSWIRRRQYGSPSVPEFCNDIQVRKGKGYVVTGHADGSSLLSQLVPYGTSRRKVYGMVLDLDENVDLNGGNMLYSNEVQYPVAVAVDPLGEEIYVAEIFSDTKPDNLQMITQLYSSMEPDASATGYSIPMIGLSFSIRLQKFTSLNNFAGTAQNTSDREVFHPGWSREYGTLDMENVQASTIDYVSPSSLILTGFTRGQGQAFGEGNAASAGTLDSFVMKVDPSSGQLIESARIESVLPGDDRILGTCLGNSTNEMYLVGMTSGLFDSKYVYYQSDRSTEHHVYAFIQKFDLGQMKPLWSRQIGAISNAGSDSYGRKGSQINGLSCVVTPDGEEVYMAGNVKDGASFALPNGETFKSGGATDIFVTKFHVVNGTMMFAAQIGSAGNDTLAAKRSLSTDKDGNLILLGNTDGSMYRNKKHPGGTNIFTMSVGRVTGDYISPFDSNYDNLKDGRTTFFGQRYDDPAKQARYENGIVALLSVLCLLLGVLITAVFVCWKRSQEKQKGYAVKKASLETCESFSDESDWEPARGSFRYDESSVSIDTNGWIRGQGPSSVFSFVRPSLEISPPLLIEPQTSKRAVGRGADGYFGSTNSEFSEDAGSILSLLGRRRTNQLASSGESVGRSFPKETEKKLATSYTSNDRRRRDDGSSAYGEIYDLLSTASERLGLDTGNDPGDDFDRPKPRKKNRWRKKKEDDTTLEELWNLHVI